MSACVRLCLTPLPPLLRTSFMDDHLQVLYISIVVMAKALLISILMVALIPQLATSNDIMDVDWSILHDLFEAYLYSGQSYWFVNIQKGNTENTDLRTMLSYMTVLVCELEFKRTVVDIFYSAFRPFLLRQPERRQRYGGSFRLLIKRYFCCRDLDLCANIISKRLHRQLRCDTDDRTKTVLCAPLLPTFVELKL